MISLLAAEYIDTGSHYMHALAARNAYRPRIVNIYTALNVNLQLICNPMKLNCQ